MYNMTKEEDILLYSNPKQVFKDAKKLFGNDVEIKISTRKDKKYMIKNPENDKWVHFGQMFAQDYTYHKDKERQKRFKIRNHKWANMNEFSPAYLSYHLLW